MRAKQKPLSKPYMISLLDRYMVKMEAVINLWLHFIKAMPGLHPENEAVCYKTLQSPDPEPSWMD